MAKTFAVSAGPFRNPNEPSATDRPLLFKILIDLVVLNLFDEFSHTVRVASFNWSLLAAILLQALLKGTLAIEHYVAVFFNTTQGAFMKFMRFFGAWLVLLLSMFVILEVITFVFGDRARFEGMMHGVVPLIMVVTVMVIAEEVVVRFVRWFC